MNYPIILLLKFEITPKCESVVDMEEAAVIVAALPPRITATALPPLSRADPPPLPCLRAGRTPEDGDRIPDSQAVTRAAWTGSTGCASWVAPG